MPRVNVERTGLVLRPDTSRVVFREFNPSPYAKLTRIVAQVAAMSESEAREETARTLRDFASRHRRLESFLIRRFEALCEQVPVPDGLSEAHRMLLGAYLTQEYALEAAALFNPSIVPHPDQTGVPAGALRFVLSLRATGEGHISSIVFRTGRVDARGRITLDPPAPFANAELPSPNPSYERAWFEAQLYEAGLQAPFADAVLEDLGAGFTLEQLERAIARTLRGDRWQGARVRETAERIRALARANYDVSFAPETDLSERVIFPSTPAESGGIEDARFVAFQEDDGRRTYYATYTAYDGREILPQLLQTGDFQRFRISTLNGAEVRNKGLALFPRRIRGRYAMLSRQDNENLFLMYSDSLHIWTEKLVLLRPRFPWEFVQLGNCGSPIETDAGWLVLTHGVGPVRRYAIGAILLDRDDPSRVLGRLPEPLLTPAENERAGYVPNVLYSCGALVHAGRLILPYALSDQCASFATVPLDELLAELQRHPEPSL